MDREGLKLKWPSLAGARSIDDILQVVEGLVRRAAPGEWIVTMPIGEPPMYEGVPDTLAEKRWPTRHDLDRVAPDHPVYIRAIWGHWRNTLPLVSIANTQALARAGIGRDTRPPAPSIEIERDAEWRAHRRPHRANLQAPGRAHVDGRRAALHAPGPRGGPRRVDADLQPVRHDQRVRGPRYLRRGRRRVSGAARARPAERAGASAVEPGVAVGRCGRGARPRAELGRLAQPSRPRRRVSAGGRALHGIRLLGGKPPARDDVALYELGELLLQGGPARRRHGRDDDRGREERHPRRQLHAEHPRPLRAREPGRAHRRSPVDHRAHRRLRTRGDPAHP